MENVDGVLLVDKDPDMTSHDVVSVARRTLGQKKIGHCGTLDPMATGLLILTLGRGTKIQDLLMAEDKEYVGTVRLGEETTTQDKEGEIVLSKDVPELDEHGILSDPTNFLKINDKVFFNIICARSALFPQKWSQNHGKTIVKP